MKLINIIKNINLNNNINNFSNKIKENLYILFLILNILFMISYYHL